VTRTPTLSRKQFARRRFALAPAVFRKGNPRKADPHPDPLPKTGEGDIAPVPQAGDEEMFSKNLAGRRNDR